MKCWVSCDLITPRTIPGEKIPTFRKGSYSNVGLYKNYSASESDKPWAAYLLSHLNVSISVCLWMLSDSPKQFTTLWKCAANKTLSECLEMVEHTNAMGFVWKCVFHSQPSHQFMQQLSRKTCPNLHQLTTKRIQYKPRASMTMPPMRRMSPLWRSSFSVMKRHHQQRQKKVTDAWKKFVPHLQPIKLVYGAITIESEECPVLRQFWLHNVTMYEATITIVYNFTVGAAVRVNITLVEVQLMDRELVNIWNTNIREGKPSEVNFLRPPGNLKEHDCPAV